MKKLFVSAASILALVSCAQNNNNNQGLDDGQKARFVSTLDSIGRAQDAVRLAGVYAPATNQLAAVASGPDDARVKMSSSLGAGKCRINVSGLGGAPGVSNSSSDVSMTAAGDGCPISMNLAVKIDRAQTSTGSETNGAVSCDYAVKDAAYLGFNDVDSISEKGIVHQTMTSGMGSFSVDGSVTVNGAVHSQAYGNVNLSITGKTSGNSVSLTSEIDYALQFQDFGAVLRHVSSASHQGGQKEAYFLNGAEISKDEFNDMLNRGGAVFGAGLGN